MPKALIVYFSQSGSTAKVSESIAGGLRAAGYQVDLFNIKDGRPPQVKGYDLFGMGVPAYMFRPPYHMIDYANSLPDLKGLPAFVFVMLGSGVVGETGDRIRRILARKRAKDAGYFKCFGADFYFGYLREGYLFSPSHPTKEELNQAENFGRQVADNVAKGQFIREPNDSPLPSLVYRLERLLNCRLFTIIIYSWLFFVKKSKCTACGVCMKTCPVGNIKADKKGRPTWGHKCILCLYCEFKCPENAIISPVHLPLFRIFMIYNTKRASKNPSIERIRVVVKNGCVEPVETK